LTAARSILRFISAPVCEATLPSAQAPWRSAAVKVTVQLMGWTCPQARPGPRSCAKGPLLRERRGSVGAHSNDAHHHLGMPKVERRRLRRRRPAKRGGRKCAARGRARSSLPPSGWTAWPARLSRHSAHSRHPHRTRRRANAQRYSGREASGDAPALP
jgi:hypothetical protein